MSQNWFHINKCFFFAKTQFFTEYSLTFIVYSSFTFFSEVNATVMTAIAMQEDNSDGIHVELNPITELRFIRKVTGTSEQVEFYDLEWLDFNGKFLAKFNRYVDTVLRTQQVAKEIKVASYKRKCNFHK